jgi:hypothetical protein
MSNQVLISDEIIETFRAIYDSSSGLQWSTGDYLVEVVDELAPQFGAMLGDDNTSQAFHRARASIIKQLAYGVGCDTTTLYDREGMSRFYSEYERKEYHMLTYHQLRACKSAGNNWRTWAEWARSNLPAPVAMIRAKIKQGGREEPSWISRWQRIIVLAGAIRDDSDAPQRLRQLCGGILRSGVQMPAPGEHPPTP